VSTNLELTAQPSSTRYPVSRRSSPDEKSSCNREPRSGERYIAWGVSPRIRTKKREEAAERRQTYRGDVRCSRHDTDLSPPSGAFILLPCEPWGSRPRLKTCRASGAFLHLVLSVRRRSILICLPIAKQDPCWVLGTGHWLLGGWEVPPRCNTAHPLRLLPLPEEP
jgi:hypothetical protein